MRSRNGSRKLNQSLNRRWGRYSTRMLGGARRPDYLGLVCRALTELLRLRRRMAKADPHLFGHHAHKYFLDTLKLEREELERGAALRRAYGPPKPGEPKFVSTLWTDRYYPEPGHRKMFLQWFHEKYPSP